MKKYPSIMSTAALGVMLLHSPAQAEEATATFNVTFTYLGQSCELASGNDNIAVDLGTRSASSLRNKGSESPSVPFHITLNCANDMPGGVQVTFSGEPDTEDTALLALSGAGSDSTAGGVGIAMYDQNGDIVPLNASGPVLPATKGTTDLSYTARYRSTRDDVTAGAADAVATFTLVYP